MSSSQQDSSQPVLPSIDHSPIASSYHSLPLDCVIFPTRLLTASAALYRSLPYSQQLSATTACLWTVSSSQQDSSQPVLPSIDHSPIASSYHSLPLDCVIFPTRLLTASAALYRSLPYSQQLSATTACLWTVSSSQQDSSQPVLPSIDHSPIASSCQLPQPASGLCHPPNETPHSQCLDLPILLVALYSAAHTLTPSLSDGAQNEGGK